MSGAVGTVIKLFVLCVIVGLFMSWFEITPENLFDNFGETLFETYIWLRDLLRWTVPYALIGAVIVLPVYGLMRINDFWSHRKAERIRRGEE